MELTRAYLVNHFGQLLTNDTFWSNRQLTEDLDEADRQRLRQAVTGHPSPAPEILQEAETVVAPHIQRQPRFLMGTFSFLVLFFGAAAFALVEFVGCAVFGQSPILRLFGLAAVSRHGWPATRARLLWRWAMVWVPFGALAITAALPLFIQLAIHAKMMPAGAISQPVSWSAIIMLSAAAAAFLAGLWFAALHPERGLADRLAGTSVTLR